MVMLAMALLLVLGCARAPYPTHNRSAFDEPPSPTERTPPPEPLERPSKNGSLPPDPPPQSK